MQKQEPIDFVMLWVDGSDPAWFAEKQKYAGKPDTGTETGGENENRFRSWDNLQYFFRGVEKFAPWVRYVFLVTNGQVPAWIQRENPKLKIVFHKDYIPAQYLPTFNSNTIIMNLHRIPELSEHFVLFNDDIFITKPIAQTDFFRNGLPCDMFMEYPIGAGEDGTAQHMFLNNNQVVARYYKRKEILKAQRSKILYPGYGAPFFYNLFMSAMPYPYFFGLLNIHIACPRVKSVFEELWEKEYEIFDSTCSHKFRDPGDITDYVCRLYSMCRGQFAPFNRMKLGHYYKLGTDDERLLRDLRAQKQKLVCIADNVDPERFEEMKQKVNAALQEILPERSSYELEPGVSEAAEYGR